MTDTQRVFLGVFDSLFCVPGKFMNCFMVYLLSPEAGVNKEREACRFLYTTNPEHIPRERRIYSISITTQIYWVDFQTDPSLPATAVFVFVPQLLFYFICLILFLCCYRVLFYFVLINSSQTISSLFYKHHIKSTRCTGRLKYADFDLKFVFNKC